jgi:hypothetical protein
MDPGDITQLALLTLTFVVLGRIGWALARLIDRRGAAGPAASPELAERLRALEEEQLAVRQELAELQERQDFTERSLVQDPRQTRPAPAPLPGRVVTPR